MKVYELIELLKEKPQELEIYLQDCEQPRFPGDRVLSMCNLDKSNVSIMQNGDAKYLAIGCTTDGIARADFGSASLDRIVMAKRPKYVLTGHVHSGNHEWYGVAGCIKVANVSLLDENYNLKYKPKVFEI